MPRHIRTLAKPRHARKPPKATIVSSMSNWLFRMLHHLIVAYPLLLCLLRPTFGFSYLDPFFGSNACNSSPEWNLNFLLPLWTISAVTAVPVLVSTCEAIHEFARCLREHHHNRTILSLGWAYVCRVVVVTYLFMGADHSKTGNICSPGAKEVILMMVGMVLHGVALVRYCARFRDAAKQSLLDISASDPTQGKVAAEPAPKQEGSSRNLAVDVSSRHGGQLAVAGWSVASKS